MIVKQVIGWKPDTAYFIDNSSMNLEGFFAREILLLLCRKMTWFRWAARSLVGGWFNGWRDDRREAAWCAWMNITIVMRIVDSTNQIRQCENRDVILDNRTRNFLQTLYKRMQSRDTGRTTFSLVLQAIKIARRHTWGRIFALALFARLLHWINRAKYALICWKWRNFTNCCNKWYGKYRCKYSECQCKLVMTAIL